MNNKIIAEPYFYYRGVATMELRESLLGKNGRIDPSKSSFNTGSDTARLAFVMNFDWANNRPLPGVNWTVVYARNILDAIFYANKGAAKEAGKQDLSKDHPGVLLIFRLPAPLSSHHLNSAMYGRSWKTTAELPAGVDERLWGVTPAPFDTDDFSGLCSSFGPSHPLGGIIRGALDRN